MSGESHERSIPLSDDDSQESYESDRGYNLHQLESGISELKAESSRKFKQRWDHIIEKYSSIDDDLESDEIDLSTGQITIDNGHLRSLSGDSVVVRGVKIHTSIWSGDYDYDKTVRSESNRELQHRRAKHKLKEKLKLERKFHVDNAASSDSDVLEDNLSLISSSPTKKARLSEQMRLPDSPVLRYGSSPVKLRTPKSSPLKNIASDFSPESPTKPRLKSTQRQNGASRNSRQQEDDYNDSFLEDSFSFNDAPDTKTFALFTCAFRGCAFSSETKAAYRSHLLSSHRAELHQIGYPVRSSKPPHIHIPELTILKLTLHFPLQVATPPIVPYACNFPVKDALCQKKYTSEEDLHKHRASAPAHCSTKNQVFCCPILGCTFMTDAGYNDYRRHIIGHSKETRSRSVSDPVPDISEVFSDSSLSLSDDEPVALSKTEVIEVSSPKPSPRIQVSNPVLPILDIEDHADDYKLDSQKLDGYSSIEELFSGDSD